MLHYFGYSEAHDSIIRAIETILSGGVHLTPDMGGNGNTADIGKAIADAL